MTAFEIREAGPEDAGAVAAVLGAAFAEYEPLYTAAAFAATALRPAAIGARMREGPLWVATRDGRVIGTVAAVPRGGACYIRGMAVSPESRARGVGWKLLETVEAFAAAQGMHRLLLSTTPFLDRAIRLYERFGFERGPEDDLFGTPLFTMTKDLCPISSTRS